MTSPNARTAPADATTATVLPNPPPSVSPTDRTAIPLPNDRTAIPLPNDRTAIPLPNDRTAIPLPYLPAGPLPNPPATVLPDDGTRTAWLDDGTPTALPDDRDATGPAEAQTPTGTTLVVEAVRALARASRLMERASQEISLAHYRVLSSIAAGDERASRIAARLALGKPTISATVESLRQRGLLTRSGVEGDQRAAALRLTTEGEQALARVEAAMAKCANELCARTPDGEQVLQALVWIGTAIDDMAAERPAEGRR